VLIVPCLLKKRGRLGTDRCIRHSKTPARKYTISYRVSLIAPPLAAEESRDWLAAAMASRTF